MRYLFPLLLLCSMLATVLLPGCEPKEELVTTDGSARLEFSADTVKFDTVFVQTRTVTKRLWVYNRNKRAVQVEEIRLAGPYGQPYKLIINGDSGAVRQQVLIRGKDSLLVLVKATLGVNNQPDNKPFLTEDQLLFRTNGNDQQVKLLAFGQNAYFHIDELLPCNAVWRNDKPHVLYGQTVVGPNCTLTIEEGTQVFCHAGAQLVVAGQLQINPNLQPTGEVKPDDRRIVRFQGDRREEFYNDVPGQWIGIALTEGSGRNHVIRYCDIKNASYGLLLSNPDAQQPFPKVTVENTTFRNISGAGLTFSSLGNSFDGGGILSFSGDCDVRNSLFTNCGEYALGGFQGGIYNLQYCTFANYTPQFQRKTASLTFSDGLPVRVPPRQINPVISLQNCIVWGSIADELFFNNSSRYLSQISVQNSVLRTQEYLGSADNGGKPGLARAGNLLNTDPKFKRTPETAAGRYDYRLDTLSPASNRAVPLPGLSRDLRNLSRGTAPDPGAYERVNP
ncbi:right-handed parallel beta-helix repeat-containing protein [Hymenobacter sp. 15J16-1T3B]|uniref:right-handed parallel beta-helix repeat-containing protein n=1 Tax=Hymenobacter sp. 15J16-1T3B TaxID=2886941 RepID=UPI001D0FC57E|nr:right-handed parallel beta-helix repeat-containing protein [Hymenobacter sp. 15J16-1T3B]MCC3160750.1 right-handed parallel beta-helix repeat-containing protein [Hymenobacter sp. 15J16-1T3B]